MEDPEDRAGPDRDRPVGHLVGMSFEREPGTWRPRIGPGQVQIPARPTLAVSPGLVFQMERVKSLLFLIVMRNENWGESVSKQKQRQ